MKSKSVIQVFITADNYKIKEGDLMWYINGDTTHGASFDHKYYANRYTVYKLKTNALRHLKVRGLL